MVLGRAGPLGWIEAALVLRALDPPPAGGNFGPEGGMGGDPSVYSRTGRMFVWGVSPILSAGDRENRKPKRSFPASFS